MTHSVRGIMMQVLVALVPAFGIWTWLFGWGLLVNIVIGCAAALVTEALMLKARGRPVREPLSDGSAVVTAVLLAFALPPLAPWWLVVIGVVFAIVVAKHLYGGIGFNPFNPAMVGYVVLLISFPVEMTRWLPPMMLSDWHPTFLETLHIVLTGTLPPGTAWDAITAATPLDAVRTAVHSGIPISEARASPLFNAAGGAGWVWLAPAFLLGGLWLLARDIIQWTIPVAVLGSITVLSAVAWGIDPERFASPVFHLLGGATVYCAFFIATDPVSAATTPRGRVVYGIGIGVLVWVIRTFGGYPDAVAFAVLLMNMSAPALDYFLRPRVSKR